MPKYKPCVVCKGSGRIHTPGKSFSAGATKTDCSKCEGRGFLMILDLRPSDDASEEDWKQRGVPIPLDVLNKAKKLADDTYGTKDPPPMTHMSLDELEMVLNDEKLRKEQWARLEGHATETCPECKGLGEFTGRAGGTKIVRTQCTKCHGTGRVLAKGEASEVIEYASDEQVAAANKRLHAEYAPVFRQLADSSSPPTLGERQSRLRTCARYDLAEYMENRNGSPRAGSFMIALARAFCLADAHNTGVIVSNWGGHLYEYAEQAEKSGIRIFYPEN